MPSLQPGFAYDIFVSYRHNDNRSGWVTDFVRALEEELGATLKDPVSVYFDVNPHDGLMDTHDVGKSLEGKLKCLIFIPIISQTYCDPKSFAWQYEFTAFNRLAKEDSLGQHIRLANGNVTSRILPLKIHDLDAADKSLLENELGGVLRSIDFISRSAGVNRPLSSKDDEVRSAGKILYRDQVNKVANAVKEIIQAISYPAGAKSETATVDHPSAPAKTAGQRVPFFTRRKILVSVISFLVVISLFIVPKFVIPQFAAQARNVILVLPFRVGAGDSAQQYFAEGITVDIITELAKVNNLGALSWETSFNYMNSSKSMLDIAAEAHASYLLTGSIRRENKKLRINVELVNPETNQSLWTTRFDREEQFILDIQKEIATNVAEALRIRLSPEEKATLETYQTKNFEAYDLFQQARAESRSISLHTDYLRRTEALLKKALALDPNFVEALTLMALTHVDLTWVEGLDPIKEAAIARSAIEKAVALKPNSPDSYIVLGAVNFFLEMNMKEAKVNLEKGWNLSGQGATPIYHCFCAYSEYHLAKGDYLGALGIVDKIVANDPFYPYSDVERFMAHRMLNNRPAMEAILSHPQGGLSSEYVPVYHYSLGQYDKALTSFLKEGLPFLFPTSYLSSYYYKAGDKHKSDSLLNLMIQQSSTVRNLELGISVVYASRGQKKEAIQWFKTAFKKRDYFLVYARTDLDLKLIMDDPEVKGILREMGLED